MKIVSKYKDYYDSAAAFGVDETVVWYRDTSKVPENEVKFSLGSYRSFNKSNDVTYIPRIIQHSDRENSTKYELHLNILYVCGEIIPFIVKCKETIQRDYGYVSIHDTKSAYLSIIQGRNKEHLDSWEDFDILDIAYTKEEFVSILNLSKDSYKMSTLNEFFEVCNTPGLKHRLAAYKEPLVLLHSTGNSIFNVIKNPILKYTKISKIKDSWTLYQEISQYISCLDPFEDPVMDEKTKVSTKGFDHWSFRNPEPPKRKRKK